MATLDRRLIQSLPVFSAMGEAEFDDVIAHASALRIPMNAAVFEQGQTATAFYVLLHGRLKVVQVTHDGQQVVIRFVNPGDVYGIAKALRREDYPATASALVDSVTLAWPADIWDDFMARHPAFATNVMQMMGQRLQEAHARVKEMSTEEVARRIAHAHPQIGGPIRAPDRGRHSRRFSDNAPRHRPGLGSDPTFGEPCLERMGRRRPRDRRPTEDRRSRPQGACTRCRAD
jgi:CRP-like cAMP-binding protein